MGPKGVDVSLLKSLYPNPKPSEPSGTCGYCVGGALMAFLDEMNAAKIEEGHKPEWRLNYFPLATELADELKKVNSQLPESMALRYAEFITRLNDRKKFGFAWSYLKEALEWKEGQQER